MTARRFAKLRNIGFAAALLGVAVCPCACDDDDDIDHKPADGKGSLVVDNHTADNIHIYVDGEYMGRVKDGHTFIRDMAPGLYRVVLADADEDGSRDFRDETDILGGRLTVLDVEISSGQYDVYAVDVRFQ